MKGSANILSLISRDEKLHIMVQSFESENDWIKHLMNIFRISGFNEKILTDYLERK